MDKASRLLSRQACPHLKSDTKPNEKTLTANLDNCDQNMVNPYDGDYTPPPKSKNLDAELIDYVEIM